MATNPLPKDELSQLFCFFGIQYTGGLFTYIINPILDRCVSVSPSWYASTLAVTTKSNPCGLYMFSGRSSLPEKCPNSLEVQS